MKTRIRSLFLSSLKLMALRGSYTACLFMIASVAGVSAQAATIDISYSLTGGPTGPPVVSGTNLILDGFFSGSILSGNPALNAEWNPVTYSDHSVVDTITGLLNGTFVMTFASGDMLSGMLFEDVSALLASGGTVPAPYTQAFTFTAGTGKFAGATGSASGAGFWSLGIGERHNQRAGDCARAGVGCADHRGTVRYGRKPEAGPETALMLCCAAVAPLTTDC